MMVKRAAILAASFVLSVGLQFAQAPAPTVQPSSAPLQQAKEPEPCTISGRVVSAAEGTPIQSARVGLIQEDVRQHPAVYGTTTNEQGHFEIKQVPPGRYRFVASRAGFISQEYGAKGIKGGAMLALSPGQTVDDAMFRLTRAAREHFHLAYIDWLRSLAWVPSSKSRSSSPETGRNSLAQHAGLLLAGVLGRARKSICPVGTAHDPR
jgi:hypothetical protein